MENVRFSRPTVMAAVESLAALLTQAQFNMLIVRLGLDGEITLDDSKSVAKKAALLAAAVSRNGTRTVATIDGQMSLVEATVREAVIAMPYGYENDQLSVFRRGLALDGYVIYWEENTRKPRLRAALPEEVALPQTDDEVHQLLKQLNFSIPAGHLDQAIDAHARGDWAAANSQVRSFLEGLLGAIAARFDGKAVSLTADGCRRLLADRGFLSTGRNEWAADGKGFINGLFRMLHTDGSHPGLSDEDHSTFRLHLALITGRVLLRRLQNNQ